jgi:hypothetical protein
MSFLSILGDTADFGEDKKERFPLLPLLKPARNRTEDATFQLQTTICERGLYLGYHTDTHQSRLLPYSVAPLETYLLDCLSVCLSGCLSVCTRYVLLLPRQAVPLFSTQLCYTNISTVQRIKTIEDWKTIGVPCICQYDCPAKRWCYYTVLTVSVCRVLLVGRAGVGWGEVQIVILCCKMFFSIIGSPTLLTVD